MTKLGACGIVLTTKGNCSPWCGVVRSGDGGEGQELMILGCCGRTNDDDGGGDAKRDESVDDDGSQALCTNWQSAPRSHTRFRLKWAHKQRGRRPTARAFVARTEVRESSSRGALPLGGATAMGGPGSTSASVGYGTSAAFFQSP
jgi:hypothetical protein